MDLGTLNAAAAVTSKPKGPGMHTAAVDGLYLIIGQFVQKMKSHQHMQRSPLQELMPDPMGSPIYGFIVSTKNRKYCNF